MLWYIVALCLPLYFVHRARLAAIITAERLNASTLRGKIQSWPKPACFAINFGLNDEVNVVACRRPGEWEMHL